MTWIKNMFIMFLVTLFVLKVTDTVFLLWHGNPDSNFEDRGVQRSLLLREWSPNTKAIMVPTDQYLLGTDTLKKEAYALNVDKKGFINNGNQLLTEKDDRETLIIFFGGSTTESMYVHEQNRFPSILERNLQQKYGANNFVYNAGVSGNNSMHSLLNLIGKGLELKPDFVVLMNNINDLVLLRKTGSYWSGPQTKSLIQFNQQSSSFFIIKIKEIKDFLIPNLYAYIRPRIKFGQNVNAAINDEWADYRGQYIDFNNFKNDYRSSLLSFIEISRAWDVEPVLMTQFNRINLDDELFRKSYIEADLDLFAEEYDKLNQMIRDIAISENVPLIDLAIKIPSTKKYIYDTIHLNEEGSFLVAEILTKFFEEQIDKMDED
jgi:lysophospholipase L1-like esterase